MEQYVIKGGNPLVGEVEIAGAKNAALAILSAAIMTDETILIENLLTLETSMFYLKQLQESVHRLTELTSQQLRSMVLPLGM